MQQMRCCYKCNKSQHWPYRFEETVNEYEVRRGVPPDNDYVLPPLDDMFQLENLAADKSYQLTGVSFFKPVDRLFEVAHEWHVGRLQRTGSMGNQCFIFDPDKLPLKLGFVYNVCYTVAVRNAYHDTAYTKEEFVELPRRSRNEKYPLALHYLVFPKKRMLYSEFTSAITLLKQLSRKVNCYEKDSGGDSGDDGEAAAYDESMKATLWLPSCMFMRVVTDALYNMFKDPTASSNDALLAFLLLHHIAAEDLPFAYYERDSVYSRLIYKATQAYDEHVDCYDSPYDNVSACVGLILKRLEAVLPPFLHIQESESDDSDESEGTDCKENKQGKEE